MMALSMWLVLRLVLYHSLAEIGMDSLIAVLGRRGQDISSPSSCQSVDREKQAPFRPDLGYNNATRMSVSASKAIDRLEGENSYGND